MPWPLNCGGHLRSFHVLRALSRAFDVRLVAGDRAGEGETLPRDAGVRVHRVPYRPARMTEAVKIAGCALRRRPYVLYGRHDRATVRREVDRVAADSRPAVVYLDHLDSWLYADRARGALVVADMHNIYSLIARRTAAESGAFVRAYLNREAGLLEAMERRVASGADLLLAVSHQEADYYRACGARRVLVAPNGVDIARFAPLPAGRPRGGRLILFLGALSWAPNAAAAVTLAEEVLPAVRRVVPDARLRIVGRHPTARVLALGGLAGVEVVASARDVTSQFAEASVLAVPLESGGGTRIKILEAFAAGLPVVSTAVGCEGLDVVDERHLLIRPRDAFPSAIASMLQDETGGRMMAGRARALVQARYDWSDIGAAVTGEILQTLGGLAAVRAS